MIGTSLLLFLVAVLFLRIQVRSIADLAEAAEEFGKGVDNKSSSLTVLRKCAAPALPLSR